jgi:nucleotide-binding universal stress UspA family protein
MFKHILVAYDGSPVSRKALDAAIELGKMVGANLSIVSVEEYVPHFPGDIGEVRGEKELQNGYCSKLQREALEIAKANGLHFYRSDILLGHVAKSIVEHAKKIQCDLIVLGHRGRSGVWAGFLGPTAEKVSRHAHCSVMIIR